MSKDKSKGKVSDIDKIIADWESKLSVAVASKNDQEAFAIRRVLEYWKRKKKGG